MIILRSSRKRYDYLITYDLKTTDSKNDPNYADLRIAIDDCKIRDTETVMVCQSSYFIESYYTIERVHEKLTAKLNKPDKLTVFEVTDFATDKNSPLANKIDALD